jgi:PAS domain S-box-containing protein
MVKILAIDDNNIILMSLKAFIKMAFPDAVLYLALNGPLGIDLALEHDPDVILLDILMPEMDGFEVCRKLKQDKKMRDIPVVFFTQLKGDKENRIKALEVGAEGFLTKPIDETELIAQIRAMVKIKEANEQKRDEKAHLAKLVAERTRELEQNQLATIKLLEDLKEENEARRKTEADLLESEIHFRTLADSGQALIWTSDLEKKCDYFNQTWLNFTGRALEQELGDGWIEVVHPDDLKHCVDVYVTAFDKREKFSMEYRILHSSGEYRWIQDDGSPRFNSKGEFIGYIGHCLDITERKKVEQTLLQNENRLRELNATKDKFFSIIAHDLKSPFNGIIGFSNLLAIEVQENNYEGIREYARIIQDSSLRAMELLENLMEWSRSQTGRMEFNPDFVEIDALINEVSKLLSDSARQKSISISTVLPKKLIVSADQAMVTAVLRNLISNAVKFTNAGGKIVISAERKPEELLVTVQDNGIGMKKEVVDRLFHIDTNFSTTGTKNETGTGLGLILCAEFVEKHGGKIWAESEVGKGSKFHFTIPQFDKLTI